MTQYDIIIIGGGIHGAGCAQAAAAQGYSCLLLEKYPVPAQGTSSRSSKLIHGGLRYLESRQFSLVKECLYERRLLLENAPELVKLVPFYIPVYKHSKRSPLLIRIGLMLYYLLGGGRFKRIHADQWPALDNISTTDLIAVYQYWDAQTDDVKLTTAVIKSAQILGAEICMNANVQNIQRDSNGYLLNYTFNNESRECHAQCVINATGPWINQLIQRIHPEPDIQNIDLIAGTHLVLPGNLDKGIYYLESPTDGRAIFVAPWKNHILIGTTETLFSGSPDEIEPTSEEIEYLLSIYNHYFNKQLTRTDVIESFAGCRVLPISESSAFSRPRDTTILTDNPDEPHLFSIYGGKLTAYRATAESIIMQIQSVLGERDIKAHTRNLKL